MPITVSDYLNKINELDNKIACYSSPIGTDAMMRRMYRKERAEAIAALKMLAVEHEFNIESLLWTADNQVIGV